MAMTGSLFVCEQGREKTMVAEMSIIEGLWRLVEIGCNGG